MIKIAVTRAAYDAIYATLPLGSVAIEPTFDVHGDREVWLDESVVNQLGAMRGPGRLSDVILRPVKNEAATGIA